MAQDPEKDAFLTSEMRQQMRLSFTPLSRLAGCNWLSWKSAGKKPPAT